MSNTIKGAKKKPRTPRIAVDSASSISTAKILYGLAEGEVSGLVDGAKSIFLDGTPLIDDAGNANFDGVRWTFAYGINEQYHISGFPDVSNEQGIGVELKSGSPWIKAFTDTQLSAVRVRLKWDRLSQTNLENGDVNGYRIDYAIDLQTDGGVYSEIIKTKIQEKTSSGYSRTHRIDLPKSTTGWQIRVRRITPDSTLDSIQDTMYVEAIAEVIDVKLAYPNTALLGLEYNAEIFGSIAKVAVHMRGSIIRVPSNYDAVARTYTGIWDGTFKDAYSNNPAWVYFDLCTQWRYGLGERLDLTMIDKWSLYALGQYCDQQVSDGQGGLEPRFTCNVYLQKQTEAYQVLSNIGGIFRAMSYWNGEKIVLDADVPQDPVYTFSRANVIDGNFEYSGTRARDRHTLAKVAWDNPANRFETEYEYIRDEKAMAKFGVKVLDLSAFGCTSQAQAQRAGLWALKTEQLETRLVSFGVGLDGFIPQVGNIVNVSDELFAGRANGGRVSIVNGAQTVIELDREVVAAVGDVLIINGASGKSERRNITAITGKSITVGAAFTDAEPEHIWAIETADLKLMRFRVMSITQNDNSTFSITAIQHEPQKYDAIDFGTDVKPTEISVVNPDTVDAPTSVTITSRHREVQGQMVATLIIGWSQVSGAVAYDVEWRKDDGTWVKVPRTGNVSVEIEGVYSGNYMARVRAISAFDVQSNATTSILTEVKGKIGLPPTVVGLTATGILFGMDLKWGFVAGSGDAAFTEIQVGSAPDVNVATLTQVSYPTNTHTVTGLQGNLSQSYRARLVDKLGFKSPWSAWVTGTTDANADKVMDLIEGQINEGSLNQSLTTKIDKIAVNESAISAETQQRIDDILAANEGIATETTQRKEADIAINSRVDTVVSKTDTNTAGIASEVIARTDADTALSGRIDILVSSVGDNNAAIVAEQEARADADGALASDITSLQAVTSSNTANISSLDTVVTDGLSALSTSIDTVQSLTATAQSTADQAVIDAQAKSEQAKTDAIAAANIYAAAEAKAKADAAQAAASTDATDKAAAAESAAKAAAALDAKNKADAALAAAKLDATAKADAATAVANAAQTAANNAATAAGNKGEVIFGSTTPAAIKQLAQNLWIDTTEGKNTPKRWDGNAWSIVTDKAATDAQSAANAAQATATEALGKANTATSNIATIQTELSAVTTQSGATASAVQTLQTTVGSNTASIQTSNTVIDGLRAQSTTILDVNGYVVGTGTYNDGKTGEFAVYADNFYVAPPVGGDDGVSQLIVRNTASVIDGVTVPAGLYTRNFYAPRASIDSIQIKDAAIKTAKIDALAVKSANIDNLAVTTGKIANLAVDTLQIKGNAVTVPLSQYKPQTISISAPSTATVSQDILSLTFSDMDVNNVIVSVFFESIVTESTGGPTSWLELYANGMLIRTTRTQHITTLTESGYTFVHMMESPVGVTNYVVRLSCRRLFDTGSAVATVAVTGSIITIMGVKK